MASVKDLDENQWTGVAMLAVGVALMLALDPWVIGLVFVIIGIQRFSAEASTNSDQEDTTDG